MLTVHPSKSIEPKLLCDCVFTSILPRMTTHRILFLDITEQFVLHHSPSGQPNKFQRSSQSEWTIWYHSWLFTFTEHCLLVGKVQSRALRGTHQSSLARERKQLLYFQINAFVLWSVKVFLNGSTIERSYFNSFEVCFDWVLCC